MIGLCYMAAHCAALALNPSGCILSAGVPKSLSISHQQQLQQLQQQQQQQQPPREAVTATTALLLPIGMLQHMSRSAGFVQADELQCRWRRLWCS